MEIRFNQIVSKTQMIIYLGWFFVLTNKLIDHWNEMLKKKKKKNCGKTMKLQ